LFALTPDEIDVLVHPQSIIPACGNFGSFGGGQWGAPDMVRRSRIASDGPIGLSRRRRRLIRQIGQLTSRR